MENVSSILAQSGDRFGAGILKDYEDQHNVMIVILDRDALEELNASIDQGRNLVMLDDVPNAYERLNNAVKALFGVTEQPELPDQPND